MSYKNCILKGVRDGLISESQAERLSKNLDEVMDDNLGFVFDYSMPNEDSLSDKSSSEGESDVSDSDDPSKIDIDDI